METTDPFIEKPTEATAVKPFARGKKWYLLTFVVICSLTGAILNNIFVGKNEEVKRHYRHLEKFEEIPNGTLYQCGPKFDYDFPLPKKADGNGTMAYSIFLKNRCPSNYCHYADNVDAAYIIAMLKSLKNGEIRLLKYATFSSNETFNLSSNASIIIESADVHENDAIGFILLETNETIDLNEKYENLMKRSALDFLMEDEKQIFFENNSAMKEILDKFGMTEPFVDRGDISVYGNPEINCKFNGKPPLQFVALYTNNTSNIDRENFEDVQI